MITYIQLVCYRLDAYLKEFQVVIRWASSKAMRQIFPCWAISRKIGRGWLPLVKKLSGVVKRRQSFPALNFSTTTPFFSFGWPAPKYAASMPFPCIALAWSSIKLIQEHKNNGGFPCPDRGELVAQALACSGRLYDQSIFSFRTSEIMLYCQSLKPLNWNCWHRRPVISSRSRSTEKFSGQFPTAYTK